MNLFAVLTFTFLALTGCMAIGAIIVDSLITQEEEPDKVIGYLSITFHGLSYFFGICVLGFGFFAHLKEN